MNIDQQLRDELDSRLQEIEERLLITREILQKQSLSGFETAENVRSYNILVAEQLRMENTIRLYKNLAYDNIGR
jgi:hypothetical protein